MLQQVRRGEMNLHNPLRGLMGMGGKDE